MATQARRRRDLRPRAWVGCPGGRRGHDVLLLPDLPSGLPHGAAAGLRADLIERALDGIETTADVLCWVSRSGEPGAGDVELAWWAAARRAFARHDVPLAGFCVLNRYGWLDLGTGLGRTWARVRPWDG